MMKKAEFQKILDMPFPIEIPLHKGKILVGVFGDALLLLLQMRLASAAGAATQFLSLVTNTIQPKQNKKLILDRDGFEVEFQLVPNVVNKYSWQKVSEFKLGKNGFIFFYSDKAVTENASKFKKMFMGQDASIKNKYAIKTKQLVELLNHCRKRVLAESAAA